MKRADQTATVTFEKPGDLLPEATPQSQMNTTTTRPLVDAYIRPSNVVKRAANGVFPTYSAPFGMNHIEIAKPTYQATRAMKRVVVKHGRDVEAARAKEAGLEPANTTDGPNPNTSGTSTGSVAGTTDTKSAWLWVVGIGLVIGIVLLVEYNR